ncbi:MAG: DUF1707 domain-containing protein [Xanthobacteraceae bacterium]
MSATLLAAGGTVLRGVAILQRDQRASDYDREAAVAFLKAHYADGRLSDDELAVRSDAAYRALGVGELEWLTSDLPATPAPQPPRRRRSVVPLVLLVAVLAAWLVTVPPEVTLGLLLVVLVLTLVATVVFSPLWIPALLAFLAYRLIRTRLIPR